MTWPITLERPKDLAAATRRLAALGGKGAVLGGGLELLDMRNRPEILIPTRFLGPMSYIEVRSAEVRIGAATTLGELVDSSSIRHYAWPLWEAARLVGSPQIRAQATLAGNLLQRPRCWYFRNGFPCLKNGVEGCPAETGDNRHHAIFDGGPTYSVYHSDIGLVLHALQATLAIATPEGDKVISMFDLYADPKKDPAREHVLKPGEIIREIRFRQLDNRWVGTFLKVRDRRGFDFALASVAVTYNNYYGKFSSVRILLGAVAPRAYVPQKSIDFLQNRKLNRSLLAPAADLSIEGAQPLAHNAYKVHLVRNLVMRALEKTYDRLSWKPD
ncbi:MAG: hypothetical protein A3G34_00620 [Candidatus Lindowbacteria bacterium RIFCSPLOWO2_12_FULL_62_27]|nr:MAG: hypothetical protein A3G34_00620 [Candidatus Lindowbacteria bacterium RIFCSPLOWO2_12_FULL_62_27]OGH58184.1 MAG: hypothetical protein A3I06_00930 [Candidatus Lindowbacteria bacterium RIFCSPLOWO2_02_FULL_62_12]